MEVVITNSHCDKETNLGGKRSIIGKLGSEFISWKTCPLVFIFESSMELWLGTNPANLEFAPTNLDIFLAYLKFCPVKLEDVPS